MEYSYSEASVNLVSGSPILVIISAGILVPIAEEIIFRGLILSRLKRAMKNVPALIISSLLFASIHLHVLWASYVFMLGLILGIIALKTVSIVPSIIIHMTFNIAGSFIGYIPFPEWSTILICLISLALSVFLFYNITKDSQDIIEEPVELKENYN